MEECNELKEVLIYTIMLQLDILNPNDSANEVKKRDKIRLLSVLTCEELEKIIQIYEQQINALILKRKQKLLGKLTDPKHYCHN